jgi:hypothetical protein
MPRVMTPAMAAALQGPVVHMALLAALEFADETVYVWTGIGPTTWNGMTFTGIGDFGEVGAISEDSSVEAKGVSISLSGIPSALVGDVMFQTRVLGNAQIWLALYDASLTLIADPFLSYQGKMDAPELSDDAKTCTCTIALENILVDLNRECYRRYTDEDQQLDLADTLTRLGLPLTTVDTGFTHVAGLQEQITFWGRAPSSVNNV